MEEKHIIAPSRKKEILQKLSQLSQDIQKSAQKITPKPQTPPPAKTPSVQEPKISKEASAKILTYTLIIAVVSIIGLGIYLSTTNVSQKQKASNAPVFSTHAPTKPVTVTPMKALWKPYSDSQLGIGFEYPPDWDLQVNPLKILHPQNKVTISVSLFDPKLVGVTYCGAHPEDKTRCETFAKGLIPFAIDWSEGSNGPFNAQASSKNGNVGVSIMMEKTPQNSQENLLKTDDNQELFRSFISTFKFLD